MKQGKRLTVDMKKLLTKNGFNHENYLYIKNTTTSVEFVHRTTGETVEIQKGR